MDPSNNKSSDLERRISMRNSVRVSFNGGDDEFDAFAGMVSDGFRPTHSGPPLEPITPSISVSSASSIITDPFAEPSDLTAESDTSRPSSVAKAHRPHESLSLRHDGGMGPIHQSTGLTRTSSVSTQSTAFIPAADSPYRGPSGPSHPYEMYPQNVRWARTMSMTTSSTEPISESSYTGPRVPAHPYGLYPQDTVVGPTSIPAPAIPIGFNGLPDRYQRRIGPEGEDIADIIGPDGHTEQLPPYTRYPDETYARKLREVDDSSEGVIGGVVVAPAAPVLQTAGLGAIPGAGGLGLATRNPEFESMDDLGTPQSRHSSRSFTSDSDHEINTAAAGMSEKGKPPAKGWQEWMRRRVWGIVPVWSICLTIVVLLLMGVILGSVVGAFMSKQKRPPRREGHQEPSTSQTATVTFDATPIPTPTDLPPLPLGTFGMPLMTSRVLSACFADTTLAQAWQCHLVISGLRLTIQKNDEKTPGDYSASITCNQSHTMANNVYSYGEQPFLIEKPATLELVSDTYEPSRGPAWFKMLSYNKTVIVPEGVLIPTSTPSGPKHKGRNARPFGLSAADFKRKGIISPGDKPWICNWPETYLELFIYAQQNSSWAGIKPPSFSSSSPTPTPTSSESAETSSLPYNYKGGSEGNYWPPPAHADAPKATDSSSTSTVPTPTESSSATSTMMYGPIDTGDNFTPPPPSYPRVIKLEERRMYGRSRPMCRQVEIQEFGQPARPVLDSNGKPIVIEIVENEPPPPESPSPDMGKRSAGWSSPISYRDNNPSGPDMRSQCGCMWFLT
ncbi:hypothetical protein B0T25DRAFT_569974 [Lasiosphaeria hispida]|uniref:DUF7820 domain-containing protein n=1 Tax=Lasiosphaeria hispida TaxID=260671 RepID=A0AAJ0MCB4_9PEZI|nr:hypothetical protein B0T25DRAFT_569974 [Lasiosphaeria hispida]